MVHQRFYRDKRNICPRKRVQWFFVLKTIAKSVDAYAVNACVCSGDILSNKLFRRSKGIHFSELILTLLGLILIGFYIKFQTNRYE